MILLFKSIQIVITNWYIWQGFPKIYHMYGLWWLRNFCQLKNWYNTIHSYLLDLENFYADVNTVASTGTAATRLDGIHWMVGWKPLQTPLLWTLLCGANKYMAWLKSILQKCSLFKKQMLFVDEIFYFLKLWKLFWRRALSKFSKSLPTLPKLSWH